MFACPLFYDFCELIKIAKFKGANIEFKILENNKSCWCTILAKIKNAKITFSTQSPVFNEAKLKGFTVLKI